MVERHYAQLRSMARHFRPDDRSSGEQEGRMSGYVPDSSHRPSYQRAYLDEEEYVDLEERRRSGQDRELPYAHDQSRVNAMRDERERFFRMDQVTLEFSRSSNSSDAFSDAMLDSSSTSSDPMVSKKARRKEQCRVNQANYRKRKRMYETKLSGQIKILEDEIQELQARKVALGTTAPTLLPVTAAAQTPTAVSSNDPIASIGDFYHALESAPWEVFPLNEHRGQGGHQQRLQYPALRTLFDRQQQEFESMESFQWQWLWYREHFDVFHLLVTSSERLDAGDQVIIRISAQLHLQIQQSSMKIEREEEKEELWRGRSGRSFNGKGRRGWDAKTLVCPVLQQFEFHFMEREMTRITSEIDWIAGVTALVNCPPEYTLAFLDEFIDRTVDRVVA
uniref:BZIP domain-containing protein n=1 Tax=Globisporangium ultimum (strain ATCC 200006 / CBS 805.95 / DAOM BR144) TaxID=431595 RepID=K3X1M2_GLOUD